MSTEDLELVVVEPKINCAPEFIHNTSNRHNEHKDWLIDRKFRGRKNDSASFFDDYLGLDDGVVCQFTAALDSHIQRPPQRGYEMVPLENDFDDIVEARHQQVVDQEDPSSPEDCPEEVVEPTVVDPLPIDVIQRTPASDNHHEITISPSEMVTTDFYVAGICCQSEIPLVHSVLGDLEGVESVEVTFVTKNVNVKYEARRTSPAVLLSALNSAGLQASLGKREKKAESAVASFPFYVFISGILLAISLGSYLSAKVEWLHFVALGAVAVASPHILRRGLTSLGRRILDINILTVAACIGAIALGEYHEAGGIMFLFGLSQWLENRCMQKARNAITSLHELQPEFATSASSNEQIPVGKIEVEDVLVVRPGDRVPVDGVIVLGASALDESMLTGESRPLMKSVNDPVFSGSMNCGNESINVKSTSTVAGSTVALLSKKVQEAAISKSKTDRIIETFAKYYTPAVVLAAIIFAILPIIVEPLNSKDWLLLALILLVSACPCALVISTPVATICGISTAARQSVLIKGGNALEKLSQLKVLSFDKTGTLTEGHFNVVSTTRLGKKREDEILSLAAQLEGHSSHPLAAAIIGNAAARGLSYSSNHEHVITIPGGGLIGIKNRANHAGIGTLQMLVDQGFHTEHLSEMRRMEDKLTTQGKKACFVGQEGAVIGVIILADNIRDNANSAVESLTSMKLKLALLTGDDFASAQHVAFSVGISADEVYSKLLPEEKGDIVENLQLTVGQIGHVGDGVNDSIALATADVGIAMGVGGSSMAIEAADVALFSNDLSSIPKAITLSQKVRRVIYQNMIVAVGIKIGVVTMAFLGIIHLWFAVAADVGSSLLVILNSLRILTGVPGKDKEFRYPKDAAYTKLQEMELQRPRHYCQDPCCNATS